MDAIEKEYHRRERTKASYDRSSEEYCCWHSVPFAKLHYVDLQHLFVVPIGHALLYGVVENFLAFCFRAPDSSDTLPVVSTDARHLIKSRAQHIYLTSDFGRKYTCVIDDRGSWRMEDYLHFTEAIAPYVFYKALPDQLQSCWGMLTAAVRHYFRPFVADEQGDGSVTAFEEEAGKGWTHLYT
ncbi:hypothetical protein PLESTM_000942600 [Pleodorina starrii]|nr:hypothetical protein PLESTM_000942600 [Pleodorina starrii]